MSLTSIADMVTLCALRQIEFPSQNPRLGKIYTSMFLVVRLSRRASSGTGRNRVGQIPF
jgi:hypothetical protein